MDKRVCWKHSGKFLLIICVILVCGCFEAVLSQETSRRIFLSLPFKTCWTASIETARIIKIASDNANHVILSVSSGKISAILLNSGERLWEADLGGEIMTASVVEDVNKNIYVASVNPNGIVGQELRIRSLSETTGITNWVMTLTSKSRDLSSVSVSIYKGNLIIGDQSGKLTILDGSDGMILWTKSLDEELTGTRFTLSEGRLIVVSENRILLVSPDTGAVIYQNKISSVITSVSLYNKDVLIIGDKKGEIRAINTETDETLWRTRYGGQISNIRMTSQGVLVTSFDNFIYLLSPSNGKEIWKRRTEGRLIIEPSIIDNSAIVTALGSPKANILDMDSGKPVNQINLNSDNFFVNYPVFGDNLIIFPTNSGLVALTNSDNKCYE